ncbi:MAG: hypothetical protein CML13_05880 [Puniceicoccaceae bacterium]|nr:hypothetical protein [Puniceicoccaceae bacterium]
MARAFVREVFPEEVVVAEHFPVVGAVDQVEGFVCQLDAMPTPAIERIAPASIDAGAFSWLL